MNTSSIEKIASAVLYEGYVLYPYRPSAVKNQQRFNFGVLYPRAYSEAQVGADAWEMQTECLLLGNAATPVEVKVRFLQLIDNRGWQEGVEREVATLACGLEPLTVKPMIQPFHCEDVLEGEIELRASRLDERLFKLTLIVRNTRAFSGSSREDALLRSLVSVHSILWVAGGEFISSIDPDERYRDAVAGCQNIGTWPVLAGEEGQREMMLSSPIILYDYPQIAPESAGDLCDGTEIDEILALRILTMTEAEKEEVRNGDERARQILERTELLPPEHFQRLHGAMRNLRPRLEETS